MSNVNALDTKIVTTAILPTAQLELCNEGISIQARGFFDQGSQKTFISKKDGRRFTTLIFKLTHQAKVVRSRGGQCGVGRRGERCCSPPASLVLLISHLNSAVDQVTCARLTDMYESASVQRHCRNGQPDPRNWSRTTALQKLNVMF
ncbi:uncharacterized protein [Procambarus clarkii]|uniref:uncharacterized protein n=1 Tax=Procambarus clarkii TaxID=6728 RepID=UPI003743624D